MQLNGFDRAHPVVLKLLEDGNYVVVDGHHRLLAANLVETGTLSTLCVLCCVSVFLLASQSRTCGP